MINIEKSRLLDNAKSILEIHSPSGYCKDVMKYIEEKITNLGYHFEYNNKGGAIVTVQGKSDEKTVGVSAHVDTLGAMVRSISSAGAIKFTLVGGPIVPSLDSEYCIVQTRDGRRYNGTFFSTSPSTHVYKDASSKARDTENMEVRLDEVVKNKEDVTNLGISNGDYIFIDPKTTVTESGFLKSRFIDDKGSVACIVTLLEIMKEQNIVPTYNTKFIITNYEEVGHGASYIPSDITEMLAVDMGCIGSDLECDEYKVSICAKDSTGPFDYDMVSNLVSLSKENNIDYAVDIYPMYGSDVGAALRGGHNIKGALIGPGVFASHGLERTHSDALINTVKLMYLYLTK